MSKDYEFIVDKYPTHRYAKKNVLSLCWIFPTHKDTGKKYIVRKPNTKGKLQHKYSLHDNSAVVRKVFAFFFTRVIEEVIKGEIFNFPGTTRTHILVKRFQDKLTKRLRSEGFYSNIDIVKSNFKIPYIAIDFGPFSRRKDYRIYTPVQMESQMFRNAENDVYQWITIPKTYNKNGEHENDYEESL